MDMPEADVVRTVARIRASPLQMYPGRRARAPGEVEGTAHEVLLVEWKRPSMPRRWPGDNHEIPSPS
nr:unnamed protein product [Digitaria exilis]